MNEEVFEKAKSMHKHEIIVTYNRGCINQTKSFNGRRLKMPDEYYNETFGGNK